jgi:hypothetical protein
LRSKIFPENPVKSRDQGNVERVDNVDKRYRKSYGNILASDKIGKNPGILSAGESMLCKRKNPHPKWKVFPI